MKNNRLGNSGFYVSELSLGSMLFGEESLRSTSETDAKNIINAFLDAGGNHIDTANAYANGESEKIIGRVTNEIGRERFTLASKARFATSVKQNFAAGLSRKVIKQQAEQSLQNLKTDYLDLYYMHGWDPHTPIEESLRAYEDLVKEGKVLYVGVSNFRAWQLMKSLSIADHKDYSRFIAGQYQYSLVNRDIDNEFISLFKSEGLNLVAWGPLGGGFLTGKYKQNEAPKEGRIANADQTVEEAWHRRDTAKNWKIIELLNDIALSKNASISQVALAWLLCQDTVSSVVIGPRTLDQCKDNLGATEVTLNNDEIQSLNELSALADRYPYSMIKAYGME
jgi:aryl-alcohol dehydrogenase-like predicted oxidoreductase